MYKDIITYELSDGTSQEQLLEVAQKVVSNWMKKQEGFLKWEIHTNSNGSYSDLVYWRSKEDAKKSEADMGNNPHGAEWFGCYKPESISSKNLNLIVEF